MKKIAVIGTGYVGLVSGAGISDFGHEVTCADINTEKINRLNLGEIPIFEPGLMDLVHKNQKSGRLNFSDNISQAIQKAEVVFIAVGTPEGSDGQAEITSIMKVARAIADNLKSYKVICTKSTVPVGTGRKISKIIQKYKKSRSDFDYVSNPEFLREGSAVKDFLWPNRIVLGASSSKAIEIMRDVYRPLYINETPIIETSIETAELIKYASNAFLAVKISFINEIANLCDEIGADVHTVAKAMGIDGRISPKFLHPGPGFGGSCFPKDTKALIAIARSLDLQMKTVEGAVEANNSQKNRMVQKLKKLLSNNLKGKSIGILGLAFKAQTDDVRESPAIDMIGELTKSGAKIKAFDPAANQTIKSIFPKLNTMNNWEEAVEDCDALVIMTEWNEFRGLDLSKVKRLMKKPVLLDCRNILKVEELKKLGFRFDNVGLKKS